MGKGLEQSLLQRHRDGRQARDRVLAVTDRDGSADRSTLTARQMVRLHGNTGRSQLPWALPSVHSGPSRHWGGEGLGSWGHTPSGPCVSLPHLGRLLPASCIPSSPAGGARPQGRGRGYAPRMGRGQGVLVRQCQGGVRARGGPTDSHSTASCRRGGPEGGPAPVRDAQDAQARRRPLRPGGG